jgi:hypothetical protein
MESEDNNDGFSVATSVTTDARTDTHTPSATALGAQPQQQQSDSEEDQSYSGSISPALLQHFSAAAVAITAMSELLSESMNINNSNCNNSKDKGRHSNAADSDDSGSLTTPLRNYADDSNASVVPVAPPDFTQCIDDSPTDADTVDKSIANYADGKAL